MAGRVYDTDGQCPALGASHFQQIKYILDKEKGKHQSNTITSVQKDNMLLETVKIKQATKDGYIECQLGGDSRLKFP